MFPELWDAPEGRPGVSLTFSGHMLGLWLQASNHVSSLCTSLPAPSFPEFRWTLLYFLKVISALVGLQNDLDP